jgi:UDP-glucose 4-epimerase
MTVDVRGRTVLVAGGAGFIGSRTARALLDRGARVVIVDNLTTGARRNVDPRATFYELNIADPELDAVMARERPELLYHFASYVLVPKSVENPLLDMDVVVGSVRLLRAASDLGVRKVVFASSGFLYGNAPRLPVREDDPIDPVSPYVVVKHATENYLRFFRTAYGLPYTVLRYAAIYGPGQVTGAMADYIRTLAAGRQAEMWGDGTKTRDYVFIDDVVDANLRALAVPDDHPMPVFNIGTGIETTLNTLYAKIAALVGAEPHPVYHPDRPGEQHRYSLDSTRARRELGWTPAHSLDEGLRATVDAALAGRT